MAEKRRVAPGWLDREEKILEPRRVGEVVLEGKGGGEKGEGGKGEGEGGNLMDRREEGEDEGGDGEGGGKGGGRGEELDRAFGCMGI